MSRSLPKSDRIGFSKTDQSDLRLQDSTVPFVYLAPLRGRVKGLVPTHQIRSKLRAMLTVLGGPGGTWQHVASRGYGDEAWAKPR